jgi:hypothetical protein
MDFEVKKEATLAENPEVQQKNGLLYVMPQSLSSTVNKTNIRQQAQRSSYDAGQTMVFDMNTGSRFVDPENCMLMFDVTTVGGDNWVLDTNFTPFKSQIGGLALIEEVHIHAKSGVELDRIQECNQYAYTRSTLRENSDYQQFYSTQWGGGGLVNAQPRLAQCSPDVANRLVIPMKLISGLFDPTVKGMKMPPGLLSGARIEITLESFLRAFGAQVGPTVLSTSYTITNPVIVCQTHELSDNSQAVLNDESADNGLEYTYTRVFTSKEPTANTTINHQIKKAVSQATRAFAVAIDSDEEEKLTSTQAFSSNIPFTDNSSSWQWRIGSNYYPQQRVDTLSEGYWTTNGIYSKNVDSGWFSNSLSYDEYAAVTGQIGNTIFGGSFETDSRLNVSGVPINNSATLTLEATTAAATTYTWYVFLEYIAVARSFLTNVEVKI